MMTQMPMAFLKVAVAVLCAAGTTSALSADLTDDVRAALARGERRVTVPKGRYELTTADKVFFRFEGLTNVVIDFSGSKLVFKRRTRYVQLTQCANVTLRNAVLDMDPLPYVQAVIEKVENPGAVWTVRLLDGYDTPFGANVWPCQVYDRKTLETKEWMRLGADFRIEPLGDRRYRVSGGSPDSRGEVGDYCVWSAFEPGEACPPGAVGERSTDGRSWMRRGINLDRCTDCTFGPNRAYGVRLRASHGLVENCTFDHTQGSAVFVGPEYAWLEGGFGNDIVFRGNRYLGYEERSTTHVGGVGAHRRWIPASAHHNVVPDDKPDK